MQTVVEPQQAAGRRPSATKQYGIYLALAVGSFVLLLAVGLWPTRRLGGADATLAMVAGCGASLAGSLLGSIPIWLARGVGLPAALPAVLGSLGLRMAVSIGLGVAFVAVLGLAVTPTLLWLAISHAVLLFSDVWLAIGAVREAPAGATDQVRAS